VFVSSGSTWSEQAELTAADGAAGDDFGDSVAIAGSTAVVGAPFHNSDAGAAYVFTQSGSTWSQQAELTAADGAAGDDFGASVAIAGSSAVVGAYGSNSSAGAAYVFVRSGGSWSPQAGLSAADGAAGDDFGHSVAIAGSTAMVGAYGSNSSAGAAYVFALPSQQAELTASAFADEFGYSVAISGATAVVGARVKTLGGYESAAAYIFVRSGSTWSEQARLTNPGCGGLFGWSVAISGATVVVGAPGGAACVFVRSGSSWSEQATLDDPGGAASDGFGDSVAISGFMVVVGAPGSNSSTGAAYVFVRSGTSWSRQAQLTAADGAAGDDFGSSVAISGSTAVVGADGSNSQAGAAYVFTGPGGTWSQQAKLTAADGAGNDQFGYSVAIAKSTAVVGAIGLSTTGLTGAAYVFANV
jgi:nucleoside-specific outer membrane channel protein Tsx